MLQAEGGGQGSVGLPAMSREGDDAEKALGGGWERPVRDLEDFFCALRQGEASSAEF